MSVPPLFGLGALTVTALADGTNEVATPGASNALAAGIGSGIADSAAIYPLWAAAREWSVVLAAALVFVGWALSAATAVRVVARIASPR